MWSVLAQPPILGGVVTLVPVSLALGVEVKLVAYFSLLQCR
jgi:hypothetical protein